MAKSFDALIRRTASAKVRARGKAIARDYLADMLLSEIRKHRGLSQQQVAVALRIKQPSLSKLENQSDMQLSTLRNIVEAMGGTLVVAARFPEGTAELAQFKSAKKIKPKPRRYGLAG